MLQNRCNRDILFSFDIPGADSDSPVHRRGFVGRVYLLDEITLPGTHFDTVRASMFVDMAAEL